MQEPSHAPDRVTDNRAEPATVLRCRYPLASVVRAIARATAGTGLTLTIWLATGASSPGVLIAAPLAGLFIVYGFVATARGLGVVEVDATGIAVSGPLGGRVTWAGLTDLRLAFYTTRRRPDSARNGWMVLKLRGGGGRVSVESEIEGFRRVAQACRQAGEAAGVKLTPATVENFAALEAGSPGPVRGLRSVLAQR